MEELEWIMPFAPGEDVFLLGVVPGIEWVIAAAFVMYAAHSLYGGLVPQSQVFGPIFRGRSGAGRVVALTFDDGPHPTATRRIMDLLEAHGARGTFFVIGRHAEACPEIVREIVRRGHEVGNHTQSHSWLMALALFWKTRDEIETCQETIHENFRPSAPVLQAARRVQESVSISTTETVRPHGHRLAGSRVRRACQRFRPGCPADSPQSTAWRDHRPSRRLRHGHGPGPDRDDRDTVDGPGPVGTGGIPVYDGLPSPGRISLSVRNAERRGAASSGKTSVRASTGPSGSACDLARGWHGVKKSPERLLLSA